MTAPDYSPADISAAFRSAGVSAGDTVFSHSNVGFFGLPSLGRSADAVCRTVLQGVMEVLGPDGTFVQPAFTYSFGNGEAFDPNATPGQSGMLSEYVRGLDEAVRSHDPMISVVALGGGAARLLDDLPPECYGEGSVWDRLLKADAWLCNLNMDFGTTLAHHVEWRVGVPYRFLKRFVGDVVLAGRREERYVDYYAADRSRPEFDPDWHRLDRAVREKCAHWSIPVGRGVINIVRLRELARQLREELQENPYFLTRSDGTPAAGAGNPN